MNTQEQEAKLFPDVEPPTGLAKRACANIWATIDDEDQDSGSNSGTFLDSAYYSPESMLPHQFLFHSDEHDEAPPEVAKPTRFTEIDDEDDEPTRSSRIGLIASISVGIIIAFLLFPVIRFAERSTRSHVAEGLSSEISRRIGAYEQIHRSQVPPVTDVPPLNLALSSWQEILPLDTDALPLSPCDSLHSPCPWVLSFTAEGMEPHSIQATASTSYSVPFGCMFSDMLSDQVVLVTPKQEVSLRSAFGQAILFRDGRIFSRVLPMNAELYKAEGSNSP